MPLKHSTHSWTFLPNHNKKYHSPSMLTDSFDLVACCGHTDGCILLSSGTQLVGLFLGLAFLLCQDAHQSTEVNSQILNGEPSEPLWNANSTALKNLALKKIIKNQPPRSLSSLSLCCTELIYRRHCVVPKYQDSWKIPFHLHKARC